jgi:rhodanese-related sulfurtransferase
MAEQAYAGDVDSRRAWEILRDDPKAVLVDVRTRPECRYVGHPDLKSLGRAPVFVEWQTYPDLAHNQGFVEEVAAQGVPRDATVLLLCRSGARSKSAAVLLTKFGFQRCYNISDGFEGPKDGAGHRGSTTGWKATGLPWQQD